VKETTKVVSMLDEKDLGLLEDMNELIFPTNFPQKKDTLF